MAAEYSANLAQTVAANGSVIFTESPVPCSRGLIYHRDESGVFRLASPSVIGAFGRGCCGKMPFADYLVSYSGNIAIPTGGTVEEISLAIAIDGEIDPSSTMIFTPAAVGDFGNVSSQIVVAVPWICRCASVSVRNVSSQLVTVQNSNITFIYRGVNYR